MKKIFMSFITILLCLSLSSCKDKTCEKDPSQEKCQPAELTCVEDPSQEKCQPAELTCDEDPNQEKCQPAELTCEEEPNQEKCIDSRYANIESIRLNMFGSVYTGISFTTPIEIANFLNEFKILEVEFIEELGSAETDEELNAINDDFLENRGGYDSMTISIKYKEAIETSNKKMQLTLLRKTVL